MSYSKEFFIKRLNAPIKEHLETITLQNIKIINVPVIGRKNDNEEQAFLGRTLLRIAKLIAEHPNADIINYQ